MILQDELNEKSYNADMKRREFEDSAVYYLFIYLFIN
jgi:hypothetical protein